MALQQQALRSPFQLTPPRREQGGGPVEVVVLHTTTEGTLLSLRTAARLAAGLAARIRLLVLEVVPFPLDLRSPRVPVEFTQRRFRTVVSGVSVDTFIEVRLGRDEAYMIESALKPRSLIVLEGRRSWWRPAQYQLAQRLERLGHHVVFSSPS
jgi:hypothetical protein